MTRIENVRDLRVYRAAEAAETRTWLTFAAGCGYLEKEEAAALDEAYDHVLVQLVTMARHPEHRCVPRAPARPLTPSAPRGPSSAGNPDHP